MVAIKTTPSTWRSLNRERYFSSSSTSLLVLARISWYPLRVRISLIPVTSRLMVSELIFGRMTPMRLVFLVRSVCAWEDGWYPVSWITLRMTSFFSLLTYPLFRYLDTVALETPASLAISLMFITYVPLLLSCYICPCMHIYNIDYTRFLSGKKDSFPM